jgi:type II secretory pathway pseudopilin PulG
MKTIIQILLWIGCAVFAYLIYQSITGPIQFAEVKKERYAKVISSLKDIRNSQEAYKTVNGKYAKDFKTLINFVDTGKYIITSQKDSSFMRFNKDFQIDMPVDTVVIKVLDSVPVKDSLFRKDNRFKTMMNVPGAEGTKFEMKADIISKGDYRAPVFEAKVAKNAILGDQPKDLRARENAQISVEEVNGSYISVGSLTQVSTSGNWPPIYDRKGEQ